MIGERAKEGLRLDEEVESSSEREEIAILPPNELDPVVEERMKKDSGQMRKLRAAAKEKIAEASTTSVPPQETSPLSTPTAGLKCHRCHHCGAPI